MRPVDQAVAPPTDALSEPVAAAVIHAEWAKADNSASCAPIAFGVRADAGGTARAADFSGGWAVAFDRPDMRSAYGIAGAGVATKTVADLRAQWPYTMVPSDLPEGSFAGYGVEGGGTYPARDPDGRTVKSLAYVRIEGQGCLYNIWSSVSRAHLEAMLQSLRVLPH